MVTVKNLKLTALDGSPIDDALLSADFRAAEKMGPFRVGKKGFFYRDGLKKFCIPLDIIDNAFTRVEGVCTHCCCGGMELYIYRLVVCSQGKELADVRTEDEKLVERVQARLHENNPNIRIGFTKPEEPEE